MRLSLLQAWLTSPTRGDALFLGDPYSSQNLSRFESGRTDRLVDEDERWMALLERRPPMTVELHSNGLEGSGQERMTKAVVAKLNAPNAHIPPRTHLPRLAARRVMTRSGTSASPYRPLRPASTLYA